MAASSEPWSSNKDDYELQEVIGEGGTATVQIAYCKPKDRRVAIKRIGLDKTSFSIDEVVKEVQVMSRFDHENIARYHTAFVVKHELWIVMRLYLGGSILDIIKHIIETEGRGNGVLDEITIATVLKEVLKGLDYVHQNNFIHRDVKAGNILLGEDGAIALTDFGVSGLLYDYNDRQKQKTRKTFVGTPCWMAPEVMEQVVGYNEKADIWSLGITAIELAVGNAPYYKFSSLKILMMTIGKEPPQLDDCFEDGENNKYSKQFKKIIERCLQKDPAKRPSVAELRKDPFFKKGKDREWILKNLMGKAPKIAQRKQKVKRVPGTSGRLHKTNSGNWEWSDDEYDDEKGANGEQSTITAGSDPGDEQSISFQQYQQLLTSTWQNLKLLEQRPDMSAINTRLKTVLDELSLETKVTPGVVQRLVENRKLIDELFVKDRLPAQLNMTIRMRNAEKRLNDIQFPFTVGTDTPVQLAAELVTASHINALTANAVAASIQQIIDHYPLQKKFNFKLSDVGISSSEYDEKNLIGFATLSVS